MKPVKTGENLFLFLMISFLLPLVSVVVQTRVSNHFVSFILYGIQAAAPTISAIVVLILSRDRQRFISKMFRKEHLRMAVILPAIIACTAMLSAKLLFCAWCGVDFNPGSISAIQFITISWSLISEEIGWRGYLAPLLKTYGIHKWAVPCAVGIIWGLWHYHYFLQGKIEVPAALFLIGCLIESYIYSFLMNLTNNNIVSAMSYHFAWNLFLHVFTINPSDNNGNIFPYAILVGLEIFVLLIFWSIGRTNTDY